MVIIAACSSVARGRRGGARRSEWTVAGRGMRACPFWTTVREWRYDCGTKQKSEGPRPEEYTRTSL